MRKMKGSSSISGLFSTRLFSMPLRSLNRRCARCDSNERWRSYGDSEWEDRLLQYGSCL
jgi:hypothetical protein